jgi:uncharacterized membrane protein YkvA (DUF1232 family)
MERLLRWARTLRREVTVVYLAARDPRVPWYAKLVGAAVAGYALSPIDLIPDFIPVVGQLDDAIIVPLGLWLALRLIPPALLAELRERVACGQAAAPKGRAAAVVIVVIWCAGAAAAVALAIHTMHG